MLQAASRLPITAERLWFGSTSIYVGFVVDEMALEQVRPRIQTFCDLRNFILRTLKHEQVLKNYILTLLKSAPKFSLEELTL
jgi:hypothetical protein